MATFGETKGAMARAGTILARTYNSKAEDVEGILKPLMGQPMDAVFAAIDAHITDTRESGGRAVGGWAPKAADLLLKIEQRNKTSRKNGAAKYLTRATGPAREVETTIEIRNVKGGIQKMKLAATVTPCDCQHCGDDGTARFYYDPNDDRRCWLADEAVELPEPVLWRLRVGQAICDCSAGINDERRHLWCSMFPGSDRTMRVWPILERIKQLASTRLRRDMEGSIE